MMLKPSIDKLLDKVPSKYSLVILQAKRAHELAAGAEPTQEFTSVKPTLQALEEIESGNVTIHPDPESKRELARLKVIQARLAAEEEERKIKVLLWFMRRGELRHSVSASFFMTIIGSSYFLELGRYWS